MNTKSIAIVRIADSNKVGYLSISQGQPYTVAPWDGRGNWDDVWECLPDDCAEHVAAWTSHNLSKGYGAAVSL